MKSNLYIPEKIYIGFQTRADTFTGKLAYIIYEDEKGVLRKKDSWESWRDQTIDVKVFENKPQASFVLNKGVQRHGHFGSGRSVIRVYDQRDFEFEISIDNLLGILMHSDVSKRDIVEDCVFAWSGKDLVLLPVNSEEYRTSVEFTDKQSLKVSAKELVKGYVYEKKKTDDQLMYIGYYEFFEKYSSEHKCCGKKHVFYNIKSKRFETPAMGELAQVKVEEVQMNFAEIDKIFHASLHFQEIKDIHVENNKKKKYEPYASTTDRYKVINNRVVKISYNNYYAKAEVQPEYIYFSFATFKKTGKTSNLNFENFNDNLFIDSMLKEIGLEWNYTITSGYYGHKKLSGKTYSKNEYLNLLESQGFGNEIVAINVLDEKSVWL